MFVHDASASNMNDAVVIGALSLIVLALTTSAGIAGRCPGNPHAIGTSRVIAVNPATLHRVGTLQYPQTLPLRDHEIVLSFDDGPLSPSTNKVLDALAAECVEANFFILGERAEESPNLVRRAYREGHTIGTHTQTHPHLPKLRLAKAKAEIRRGIAATAAALGHGQAPAPFFRAPYLEISPADENYLWAHGLMLWGIDVDSRDWEPISADEVIARTLRELEKQHKGIVLLHDIWPQTAAALPKLLRELNARGYRIVHVTSASVRRHQPAEGSVGEQLHRARISRTDPPMLPSSRRSE